VAVYQCRKILLPATAEKVGDARSGSRRHLGAKPRVALCTGYKQSAGDEARTRDVHLGKVVLYQLSYTRSFEREQ
jgi:hypothetical protein